MQQIPRRLGHTHFALVLVDFYAVAEQQCKDAVDRKTEHSPLCKAYTKNPHTITSQFRFGWSGVIEDRAKPFRVIDEAAAGYCRTKDMKDNMAALCGGKFKDPKESSEHLDKRMKALKKRVAHLESKLQKGEESGGKKKKGDHIKKKKGEEKESLLFNASAIRKPSLAAVNASAIRKPSYLQLTHRKSESQFAAVAASLLQVANLRSKEVVESTGLSTDGPQKPDEDLGRRQACALAYTAVQSASTCEDGKKADAQKCYKVCSLHGSSGTTDRNWIGDLMWYLDWFLMLVFALVLLFRIRQYCIIFKKGEADFMLEAGRTQEVS